MLRLFPAVLPSAPEAQTSVVISSRAGRGLVQSQNHQDMGKKHEERYKQARIMTPGQQEQSQKLSPAPALIQMLAGPPVIGCRGDGGPALGSEPCFLSETDGGACVGT